MEGPRSPSANEWPNLIQFLDRSLRQDSNWSIAKEYPTALTPSNLHNIQIISDEDQIVSHAVVKPLIVKTPHLVLKVGAIGSVVTNPEYRNQGYSSQIIQSCLKLCEKQQCDISILWTDLFEFYRKFDFELAGYEYSFVIDKEILTPNLDLRFSNDPRVAVEAILRLYTQHTVCTVRSTDELKKYLSIPNTKIYTAWSSDGRLAAYAVEGKGIDLNGYIHEWGGSTSAIMGLLNYIYKIKKEAFTFISPKHSQGLIHQLNVQASFANEGHLGMIKIMDFNQFSTKIKRAFRSIGVVDIVLEKQDENYIIGCGNDLYKMSSIRDLTKLIFGPIVWDEIEYIRPETRSQLAKLLPLPFWIWGWDSI
jgi:predicted acetyltransferase